MVGIVLTNFSEIRQHGADYEFGANAGNQRLVFYVSFKVLTDVFGGHNPVIEASIVKLYAMNRGVFESAAQRAWDGKGHSNNRVRLEIHDFTDL